MKVEIKNPTFDELEKYDFIKPDIVTVEHLEYLDELRESGETNMFGARPYLMVAFPELIKNEAMQILTYWMQTFSERNPNG